MAAFISSKTAYFGNNTLGGKQLGSRMKKTAIMSSIPNDNPKTAKD